MQQYLAPGVKKREILGWAMFDFANSGYTTVVITAIFNAYFVSVATNNAPWGTFAWTAALAVSYALVMLSAPIIGIYADQHSVKKRALAITAAGCALFTAALAFVGPGEAWLAIALIILSNYFFGTGENIAAAFLPDLAHDRGLGKISGFGWSLGYIGGLLTLGICLAYVTQAEARGENAAHFVPITMLITAVMFALASLPTFLFLKERKHSKTALPKPLSVRQGLASSFQQLKHHKDLRKFLICLVFYQAGIQAVIALAAIYADQAMHFSVQDTIILIFAVNITAAVGAFLFGFVQDQLGHVRSIALILVVWLIVVVLAWMATGPTLFWIAANLAGFAMGSSQSAGRALVGLLSPAAQRAEFFGLWGIAVKCASILGPLTYGLVTWISGGNHRLAILFTGSYFIVGLIILKDINVARGRRAALKADRRTALGNAIASQNN